MSIVSRRGVLAAALALALLPHARARAQTTTASAPPPRPAGCTAPEHRQFDFWVGDWNVLAPNGTQAGTNRIEVILDGCVVKESWVGARGGVGTSYNSYDRTARRWHQTWVDNSGNTLLLDGEFTDGAMVLAGTTRQPDGATLRHRVRWSRIDGDPDRLRQLWETSRDGGTTWAVSFDGQYIRKR